MTLFKVDNIELPEDYLKIYLTETEMKRYVKEGSSSNWADVIIWEVQPAYKGVKPTLIALIEDAKIALLAVKGT